MRALHYIVGTALIGGAGAVLAGSTSCASVPDETRFTLIIQPDYNSYQANVDNYKQVNSLPDFRLFTVFFVIPGILLILLAAWGLYGAASREHNPVHHQPRPTHA